jgi:hypothetical protein
MLQGSELHRRRLLRIAPPNIVHLPDDRVTCMKRILCAFLLLMPFGGAAEELKRYIPDMRHETGFSFDARAVSKGTASQIARRLLGQAPAISALPNEKNFYVVSAFRDKGEDDYGRRMILARFDGTTFESLYEGRGAGDSYMQNPYYFSGRDFVILVAEEGAEYTWGHSVYHFDRQTQTMRYLGNLDLAEDTGESYDTPMAEARAFVLPGGKIEFRFYRDLISDPGGVDERKIVRQGGHIAFVFDVEAFVRIVPE